jgi:hypothetical protein
LARNRVGEDHCFLKSAVKDWLRAPTSVKQGQSFWQIHYRAAKDDPQLEEMVREIDRQRGRPETVLPKHDKGYNA